MFINISSILYCDNKPENYLKRFLYSFSDVIYFERVISDSTGTAKESIFSERTEESSAVQYFQVRVCPDGFAGLLKGASCLGPLSK